MKVLLILVSIALLAASTPLNDINNDVPFKRYNTVYDPLGRPEVFDLLAPLPETFVSSENLTLYFFTRTNPTTPTQLPLDADTVASAANFDKSKPNVFLVHGWTNSNLSDVNIELREAYLEALNVNVFVVDWSGPAGGLYVSALVNVPKVGRLLGAFIGDLQNSLGLDASQFILVGHSLGAHVVGCAGAALNGSVGIIVGLDPAGPGFFSAITRNRLDSTDGQFVQAVHTNTELFGYSGNLGTVDIRPNGGAAQPGCTDLWFSHLRSYQYLAESLTSGGFTSWSCGSYSDFTNGTCSDNPTTYLGGATIDTSASGEFYLTTNSESPYSQG